MSAARRTKSGCSAPVDSSAYRSRRVSIITALTRRSLPKCFIGTSAPENGELSPVSHPAREKASLKAAGEREKLCFLHYPPVYQGYRCREIMDLLERYGVKRCCYGHLHGGSHRLAVSGPLGNVDYQLVSADYLGFRPKKIMD